MWSLLIKWDKVIWIGDWWLVVGGWEIGCHVGKAIKKVEEPLYKFTYNRRTFNNRWIFVVRCCVYKWKRWAIDNPIIEFPTLEFTQCFDIKWKSEENWTKRCVNQRSNFVTLLLNVSIWHSFCKKKVEFDITKIIINYIPHYNTNYRNS